MNDTIFIPDQRMPALESKIESMNRKALKLEIPCHAELIVHGDGYEKFTIDVDFKIGKNWGSYNDDEERGPLNLDGLKEIDYAS